jgi:hypothetical protein
MLIWKEVKELSISMSINIYKDKFMHGKLSTKIYSYNLFTMRNSPTNSKTNLKKPSKKWKKTSNPFTNNYNTSKTKMLNMSNSSKKQ